MFGNFLVRCLHCGSEYISGDCITHCCHDCCQQGHSPGVFPMDCPGCDKADSDRWRRTASELMREIERLKDENRHKDIRIAELLRTRVPKYRRGLRS